MCILTVVFFSFGEMVAGVIPRDLAVTAMGDVVLKKAVVTLFVKYP